MKQPDIIALQETARNVREHILRMAALGGAFIGASLSLTDVVVYLYQRFLNIHAAMLDDPGRDYLFLSKGHAVPALYGMFVELGWLGKDRLSKHLDISDEIYWHPNRGIAGIEFGSGSLGHIPAVAAGVALDCKLRDHHNRVVVITGDGELNEGSIWEACLMAQAFKLDNLVWIVDRNELQANVKTEDLIPIEPLDKKFEAFGALVHKVDGHSFADIDRVFSTLSFSSHKPNVIIMNTVRGKGVSSIERKVDRWFYQPDDCEMNLMIQELHK